MTIIFTATGNVRDWKRLQLLHYTALLGSARAAGALRYRVYRDLHDAARVLMVAKLPDADSARLLREAWEAHAETLFNRALGAASLWEAVGWEGIGSAASTLRGSRDRR
jgi:hypothetical protein